MRVPWLIIRVVPTHDLTCTPGWRWLWWWCYGGDDGGGGGKLCTTYTVTLFVRVRVLGMEGASRDRVWVSIRESFGKTNLRP
jgi:hypothetical protein